MEAFLLHHCLIQSWDVTVPDTYAESHIANTLSTPEAAADHTAQQKISMPA